MKLRDGNKYLKLTAKSLLKAKKCTVPHATILSDHHLAENSTKEMLTMTENQSPHSIKVQSSNS